MPPASSSSFIPKRNPGAKPKRTQVKSVFVLSVISYSLFIAAPLASVGVFIYELQANKNSEEALAELDQAIRTFNESDYQRLLEFNDRLNATKGLSESHVSVATVLDIIARTTAQTIKFNNLDLSRTDTNTLAISADLETSAFDGALFQRGQYDAEDLIDTATFTEVKFAAIEGSTQVVQTSNQAPSNKTVALHANFTFNKNDIAYTPLSAFTVPAVDIPEITEASSDTETETTNETTP